MAGSLFARGDLAAPSRRSYAQTLNRLAADIGAARAITELHDDALDDATRAACYVDSDVYRRCIGVHLNRHEGRRSVARIIFHGNRGELRQPHREGQEDQLAALGFALNVFVLWNTRYMDDAVNHLRRGRREVNDEHLARLSPLQHEHVLMLGTFRFTLPPELAAGQRRQLRGGDGSP